MSNETPEQLNQNQMSAWLDLDGRSWFELLGPMFLAIFLIILVAAGAIQLGLFDAASISPRVGILVGAGMFVVALAIYASTSTELREFVGGIWNSQKKDSLDQDALDQEFEKLGDDFEDEYAEDIEDEFGDESLAVAEEVVAATAVAPPQAPATPKPAPTPTESIPLEIGSMPSYQEPPRRRRRAVMGPKISFKGELVGEEDLLIQGNVEGVVYLNGHNLTIGDGATVKADILAKNVIVEGEVTGDVVGQERIIMRSSSNVRGNVVAERIVMDDGAKIRGGIDMEPDSQRSAAHVISRRVTSLPGNYAEGGSTRETGSESKLGEPGFVDRRSISRGSTTNPAPTTPVNPPSGEGKREPKFGEPGFVDRRAVPRGSALPPVAPTTQKREGNAENKPADRPAVPTAPTSQQSQQDSGQSKPRVIRPTIDDSNPIDEA